MTSNWDVVVVGAGASGLALAARLADRGATVLVLEAGADFRSVDLHPAWRSPNAVQPYLSGLSSDYLWPDLMAARTDSQQPAPYARGKGVGGSSIVNGQIAIRPPANDFDEWAEAGCKGWGYADVVRYLCRLENDLDFGDADYHGAGGPTPIYRTPLSKWGAVDRGLRSAALERGFAWADDVNAPGATGVSPYPYNALDFHRVTANDAYVEPRREMSNLHIRSGAVVDTIELQGGRATSVVLIDGTRISGGEIVLSGGVVGSAEILLRSGIGPSNELAGLGIRVNQHLPVGQYVQDHPQLHLNVPVRPELAAGVDDRHTNCCVRFSSGIGDADNDLMLISGNQDVSSFYPSGVQAGCGTVDVWLNRANSTGDITLVSRDPSQRARVRQRFLSDAHDMERMKYGVRLTADLLESSGFAEISSESPRNVNQELLQAIEHGDRAFEKYLLDTVTDTAHLTGSCRMGADDADGVVVDSECRVLGVEGLRVVDASILPFCPRSNTYLVSLMLGEVMGDRLDA
ncbi:GMC family oxidoreductase [Amycolatopsis panacis]|uniref:GMC family oxidoreductase n=1 Tax=Amycolatopsis panacis TaxID=2340917 RepID=A0A419I2C7_9PSEU|nr:GMC family oxidoreductase [Amycolatopsis panacis]RJQ84005.1 GMC family oxidoreductase [Amycolatopsis panacis]